MTMPERVKADYDDDEPDDRSAPDEIAAGAICPTFGAPAISPQARHGSDHPDRRERHLPSTPGTAKGFVFISLEDETGVSNAIVTPDLFERCRLLITEEPFLLIEGEVQNTDNVVLIKARNNRPLAHDDSSAASHTIFTNASCSRAQPQPQPGPQLTDRRTLELPVTCTP